MSEEERDENAVGPEDEEEQIEVEPLYQSGDDAELIMNSLVKNDQDFEHLKNLPIKIVLKNKKMTRAGKQVAGKMVKNNDLQSALTGFDFVMVLDKQVYNSFDADRKEWLVYHELSHIGYKLDKNMDPKFFIKPHDYELFVSEIEKYGADTAGLTEVKNAIQAEVRDIIEGKG